MVPELLKRLLEKLVWGKEPQGAALQIEQNSQKAASRTLNK